MRVVMLTGPGCFMCATMERMLGERVEAVLARERPDLVALTGIATVPQYVILDGERYVGSFSGMMPVSLWELRVAAYKGV